MKFSDLILKDEEKAVFALRSLYSKYGYSQYKMKKFEEYELYLKNKDFLISDSVITFTDTNGKLMALKPDVTLSIVKNSKDKEGTLEKLYYNENVYRVSKGTKSFKELMQVGLECIGELDAQAIAEVISLAGKSLKTLGDRAVLSISHAGALLSLLKSVSLSCEVEEKIIKCISEKNENELMALCAENGIEDSARELLKSLVAYYGTPSEVLPKLRSLSGDPCFLAALDELGEVISLVDGDAKSLLQIDFSVSSDTSYYDGIVFKGFVYGTPDAVLSGGRYDTLMRKMGKRSGAIGFAVYLDQLEAVDFGRDVIEGAESTVNDTTQGMLNVALPKGRLGEKVYAMFEKAGFECPSIKEQNRKLIFENPEAGVRYFWVKPSDVPIYVERGVADIGVAGKDILLEYSPDIYELLDLNMGKCRMAVAAKRGFEYNNQKTLKVATKFVNIAESHYSKTSRDIDIIHLNGSIEIAPILGLSDVIVDIVETGTTLKENDLEVIETIVPISARLIANKTSFKFKNKAIEKLKKELSSQVEIEK